MNDVIRTLQSHRSYRSYLQKDIDERQLEQIIESAQAAPSWINGQQVSIIAIKDAERRKKLALLCGNQKYVEEAPVFLVFCLDFYRTYLASQMENTPFEVSENIDTLLVGATDVGIALGAAVTAAESLDLGTVPIGGIRRNLNEVIAELNLPSYVLPISGLCIGHPAEDPGLKPRLPKEAVYHEEAYQHDLQPLLETYNTAYQAYLEDRSAGSKSGTWTRAVANFYSKHYYEGIEEALKKQLLPFSK